MNKRNHRRLAMTERTVALCSFVAGFLGLGICFASLHVSCAYSNDVFKFGMALFLPSFMLICCTDLLSNAKAEKSARKPT